jgi:ribosomal protein L40E
MKNTLDIVCRKCNRELLYIEPSQSFAHCGTDFWTAHGERRWKPTICMACRTKLGRHAKKEQDKQIIESETKKHERALENALNSIFQSTQD